MAFIKVAFQNYHPKLPIRYKFWDESLLKKVQNPIKFNAAHKNTQNTESGRECSDIVADKR